MGIPISHASCPNYFSRVLYPGVAGQRISDTDYTWKNVCVQKFLKFCQETTVKDSHHRFSRYILGFVCASKIFLMKLSFPIKVCICELTQF